MANQKVLNFTDEEKEIWEDIEGYEGIYQASNKGRVKRLPYERTEHHSGNKYMMDENIISQNHKDTGYVEVTLCVDNELKSLLLHRVVAKAFIPNPEDKPCINHIDADKTNNKASNLEWCTYSENVQHENNPNTKLTPEKVKEIRYRYENEDIYQKELGQEYGVCKDTVSKIILRQRWKNINPIKEDTNG